MKYTTALLFVFGSIGLTTQAAPSASAGNRSAASAPSRSQAVLSSAVHATVAEEDLRKPMTFRWTPVVPKPAGTVTYRLKVWQLMEGQNGTQAMKANQPIITKDVDTVAQVEVQGIYTGPCKPPYLCDFVWNVQALDRAGRPIGANNGMQPTGSFAVRK